RSVGRGRSPRSTGSRKLRIRRRRRPSRRIPCRSSPRGWKTRGRPLFPGWSVRSRRPYFPDGPRSLSCGRRCERGRSLKDFRAEGADALRFFEKMKLVETKWQTGPTASPEKAYHAFYSSFHINATAPIQEISDVLHAAMMSEESYSVIENRIFEMVGAEGKFSGDVADALKVTQTKLKALVKR